MAKKLIVAELKGIWESLRDLPINLLLLTLALIKAIFSDTQTQLITILAILLGVFLNYQIALISFFAIYILFYFLTNGLNSVIKASLSNRFHSQDNR